VVNTAGQHYKRDQAKFFGTSYVPSDAGSERGSIFQQNAAAFYETAKPKPGERPFKISDKNTKANAP
jgi:hypothetical protein